MHNIILCAVPTVKGHKCLCMRGTMLGANYASRENKKYIKKKSKNDRINNRSVSLPRILYNITMFLYVSVLSIKTREYFGRLDYKKRGRIGGRAGTLAHLHTNENQLCRTAIHATPVVSQIMTSLCIAFRFINPYFIWVFFFKYLLSRRQGVN